MRLAIKKNNLPDLELLKLYCKEGNQEYLSALFQRYMAQVYGVCLKYLKNRDDAQDAVMQVYEKLQKDVCRYEINSFRTWLYVLCKNHCFGILRQQKSEGQKQVLYAENFMESAIEIHPLDKGDETRIPFAALKDCLRRLKKEQLQSIVQFYFRNKCYRELSEIMQVDEKKVKSYIQNGKRNLKICLESRYEEMEVA